MALQRRGSRIAVVLLAIIVLIALGGVITIQWASNEIRHRIIDVLGPSGSAEQIDVGLYTVHLKNVRLAAPPGWPAPDALRAESIDIVPDWLAWFSHKLHFRSVDVQNFYESAVRTKDGKLRILPGLKENVAKVTQEEQAEHAPSTGPSPPLVVEVDRITFHNGQFDFFDEKIAAQPFATHLDAFNANVGGLIFPALSNRSTVEITAGLGGGKLALGGWAQFDNHDSQIALSLNGVDARALEPYLLRGQKAQVTEGTLDMSLDWKVANNQLRAPGKLSIANLQIAPEHDSALGTLESIPKQAAVEALKNKQGRIEIQFELAGNLNDPKFSIDEDWTKRVGAGLAKAAGVTVEGVGRSAGDAAKGIGNALKSLIGQ